MNKFNITDEQIVLDGNKLIAEFVGHENALEYHNSWDTLMSVIEKIESTWDPFHGYFGIHICSNSCGIQGSKLRLDKNNPRYAYSDMQYERNKITATWIAITNFIKWYNANLKK